MESEVLRIAEKTNYLNKDIEYLKNVNISEWDIKAAGFSVLKFLKLLDAETIAEWEKLDKHTRTVREGLLQKQNPDIAKKILDTLGKARKGFVILNNLDSINILSIKKDAIFVLNKDIEKNIVKDNFIFVKKNTYTSYLYVNRKEFYYNSATDVLDVKGIGDISSGLLNDIKNFMKLGEKLQPDDMFLVLKKYRDQYLSRKLDIESYRELDSGLFRINNYLVDDISEKDISEIDITQNYLNYVVPLFKIFI